MKYLSLAGGFDGGEVQLMMKISPTLYLPSLVGEVVNSGGEEGGWITVMSVLASTVLNLGASELTLVQSKEGVKKNIIFSEYSANGGEGEVPLSVKIFSFQKKTVSHNKLMLSCTKPILLISFRKTISQ